MNMHNLKAIRSMPSSELNIYQHALIAVAEEMLAVRKFANEVRTSTWMKQPFYRETVRRQADSTDRHAFCVQRSHHLDDGYRCL